MAVSATKEKKLSRRRQLGKVTFTRNLKNVMGQDLETFGTKMLPQQRTHFRKLRSECGWKEWEHSSW